MMCTFLVWTIRIQLLANLGVIMRGIVLGIKDSMKERLMKKYGMVFGDLVKKRSGKYKALTQEEVDVIREKKEARIARKEAKAAAKKRRREEWANEGMEHEVSVGFDDEEGGGGRVDDGQWAINAEAQSSPEEDAEPKLLNGHVAVENVPPPDSKHKSKKESRKHTRR